MADQPQLPPENNQVRIPPEQQVLLEALRTSQQQSATIAEAFNRQNVLLTSIDDSNRRQANRVPSFKTNPPIFDHAIHYTANNFVHKTLRRWCHREAIAAAQVHHLLEHCFPSRVAAVRRIVERHPGDAEAICNEIDRVVINVNPLKLQQKLLQISHTPGEEYSGLLTRLEELVEVCFRDREAPANWDDTKTRFACIVEREGTSQYWASRQSRAKVMDLTVSPQFRLVQQHEMYHALYEIENHFPQDFTSKNKSPTTPTRNGQRQGQEYMDCNYVVDDVSAIKSGKKKSNKTKGNRPQRVDCPVSGCRAFYQRSWMHPIRRDGLGYRFCGVCGTKFGSDVLASMVDAPQQTTVGQHGGCLLYTSPSPRD